MADQVTPENESADDTVAVDTETAEATEWTPPTREDWDNVQLALKKARQDARAASRAAKAGSEKAQETTDLDQAIKAATSEVEGRYKPMVMKAAARAAFAEAGLVMPAGKSDAALSRAIRLLDLEDLDIDGDGSVSGLAEQIEEIKSDFPELFATTQKATPRIDGGDKPAGPSKPRSSAETIASMLNAS